MSHFSLTARLLRIVTPAHYLHFLTSCSLLNPLKSGFSSYSSTVSAHQGLHFRPNHSAPGHPGSLSDFAFCSTDSGALPPHSSLPHPSPGWPPVSLHPSWLLLPAYPLNVGVFQDSFCALLYQFIKFTDFTTSSILVVPVSPL